MSYILKDLTKNQQTIKDYNNLNWYMKAEAVRKLHIYRQKYYGAAVKGHLDKGSWNIKDTADELGMSVGSVSEMINVVASSSKLDKSISRKITLIEALHETGRRTHAKD